MNRRIILGFLLLLAQVVPSLFCSYELALGSWNILNDQFYRNPHGDAEMKRVAGLSSRAEKEAALADVRLDAASRKQLFTLNCKNYLHDLDIIGLQEAHLVKQDPRNSKILVGSLFSDVEDFRKALNLPEHSIVSDTQGDELVVLYRTDKYKLISNYSVPIWKDSNNKPHLTKYAQIVELMPHGAEDMVIIFVNVHLKGAFQRDMVAQARPQLKIIRDVLRDAVRTHELAKKKVLVAVAGDFNVDSGYKSPTMKDKENNYNHIVLDFMKHITDKRNDAVLNNSLLKRLLNPFKKGATGRPCTSKSVTGACEGLDYILYGANLPVEVISAQIIPEPQDIQNVVMTHTAQDKEAGRWFASDHAILKVKLVVGDSVVQLAQELNLLALAAV